MGNFWSYLSVSVLMLTGVLMIFIILLQRGRGGGLAGAFGGAGGQSALGTKAGDVFTRVTIGLAVIWVFLACLSIYSLRAGSEGRLTLPTTAETGGAALEPGTAPPDLDEEPTGAGGSGAGSQASGAAGPNGGDAGAGGADQSDAGQRPAEESDTPPTGQTNPSGGTP